MCGIAGFYSRHVGTPERVALAMAHEIRHRGPDDFGTWRSTIAPLAFAHRRLSILDLSPLGHQPMRSATGRFVTTFNGEIYNYSDLRQQLLKNGHTFRGSSDTEVMLAAFEEWGVAKALAQFVGMFALALWDSEERLLYLARDRMGEKPLYFGWHGDAFLFASELKALNAFPEFSPTVDRDALVAFLRYNCVPAPHSIFENIFKLPPATFLVLTEAHLKGRGAGFSPWPTHGRFAPRKYWEIGDYTATQEKYDKERVHDALDELDGVLRRAVTSQMVSDVPIGAFLSGGIDSSLLVSYMQAASSAPIKTFSIGFEEQRFNEAPFAAAVARHLGTDHTELYVTPSEAKNVIPLLPTIYDEPFADSSQVPTYLVSKLARSKVKVSISGDGGDELFGGYSRFIWANRLWSRLSRVPHGLRSSLGAALRAPGARGWNFAFRMLNTKTTGGVQDPAEKLMRLSETLWHKEREVFYEELLVHWPTASRIVVGGNQPETYFTRRADWRRHADFLDQMMAIDLVTYLPDDILVKVDRASMAVSLETRAPFLDHRVVELALRMPSSFKLHDGRGKWPLRELLYRRVPKNLVDRPKMGFGVPIAEWLKGDLREWAGDLLSGERLRRDGYFRPEEIEKRWDEHQRGVRNWQFPLWDILMFEAWLSEQSSRRSLPVATDPPNARFEACA